MAMTEGGTIEESVTLKELGARLDVLLEHYLYLLDDYQKARDRLNRELSAGFFTLAQANYVSSGRRYGQDYYDERMQAARRVTTEVKDSNDEKDSAPYISLHVQTSRAERQEVDVEKGVVKEKTAPDEPNQTDKVEVKASISADPLRWFGILVPQPLRSTQQSFVKAIEGPVPEILGLQGRIKDTEIAIGRLRKTIRKTEKTAG